MSTVVLVVLSPWSPIALNILYKLNFMYIWSILRKGVSHFFGVDWHLIIILIQSRSLITKLSFTFILRKIFIQSSMCAWLNFQVLVGIQAFICTAIFAWLFNKHVHAFVYFSCLYINKQCFAYNVNFALVYLIPVSYSHYSLTVCIVILPTVLNRVWHSIQAKVIDWAEGQTLQNNW